MTETEYIIVRNLTDITNALNILRDVLPDPDGVVTKDKLHPIFTQLAQWEEQLHKKIKITGE